MATERKMGPRGLLQKANSPKVSAIAFIEAHREYLVNGEVGYVTAPIIAKVESGELFPTPAMDQIRMAVMTHIMLVDLCRSKDKDESAKDDSPKKTRTTKAFTACIRDGSGAIIETVEGKPMKANFDLPQRASEWVDRRLFESSPDCFGQVTHVTAFDPSRATDTITRDESIARILKQPMGCVCKPQNKGGGGGLGFGVKAHPSKSTFSHG